MARTVVYVTSVLLLCNSILMATSLGDVVIENDALEHYLLYPLAETTTFLNLSPNAFP